MKSQLYIPKKINVGFKDRSGTYTGKIGYVIYFDDKGVLRKETSWQGWRDKKYEPQQFDNVPTDGFVLNKRAGGKAGSWSSNTRQEYVRVYDPRDFEFEITIPNMLFILGECNCHRGKGLEGKFVYGWDGTSLVLVPVSCEEYRKSQEFTALKESAGVKAKELILGATYETRNQVVLTYLGRMPYYVLGKKAQLTYIFVDQENKYHKLKDLKSIGRCVTDAVTPGFAALVDAFVKSPEGSKVVEIYTKPIEAGRKTAPGGRDSETWIVPEGGTLTEYEARYNYDGKEIDYVYKTYSQIRLEAGALLHRYDGAHIYSKYGHHRYPPVPKSSGLGLFVVLESGSHYQFKNGRLVEVESGKEDHAGTGVDG